MNVSTRSVERCLTIAASREDVYQALLDPASLSRWMYATVRIKPQKGGAYRIDWQDTALPASAQGEILEMEEGRRLVLSWFMERDGIETVASFDLEDEEGGRTLLRFRHSGFPSGADWQFRLEMISGEWDKTLENLRFLLEERTGDAHLFYQRFQVELPATRERAHLQWMGPSSLVQWLAKEAFVDPAVGGRIALSLDDGTKVEGLIRAFLPGKHLRLLWEENGRRSLIGVSFWTANDGCVMTLTQRSYAVPEGERESIRAIWEERFRKLHALLARDPGSWRSGGERVLETARSVSGTLEETWKAWTEPGSLVAWFCDRAEFTLQPGHDYSLLWTGYGETRGRLLAIEPHEHLLLSWDIPSHQTTTIVDLTFRADPDDAARTRVGVSHEGFGKGESWDAVWAGYQYGWKSMLAILDFFLREHPRGLHRTFLSRRRVALPQAEFWSFVTDPAKRAAWLGKATEIELKEGGRVRIGDDQENLLEGRVVIVEPEEGIAIEFERPEPTYIEFGWMGGELGSRILLNGIGYGVADSWPLQQRILWGERLDRLGAEASADR